jgi:hypothetical protein
MLEASIKAPAVQAAVATAGFMAFLAEVGADKDNEQQTKTRWALSYYAGKRATAPRRAAAKSRSRAAGSKKAAKSTTRPTKKKR